MLEICAANVGKAPAFPRSTMAPGYFRTPGFCTTLRREHAIYRVNHVQFGSDDPKSLAIAGDQGLMGRRF